MSRAVITPASFSPDASFLPYPSFSIFWHFVGFLNVTHVLNSLDGGCIERQGASLPIPSLHGVLKITCHPWKGKSQWFLKAKNFRGQLSCPLDAWAQPGIAEWFLVIWEPQMCSSLVSPFSWVQISVSYVVTLESFDGATYGSTGAVSTLPGDS